MSIVETSIENEASAFSDVQTKLRVAIQGVPGAFHDGAGGISAGNVF